jgi:hypothetical protein
LPVVSLPLTLTGRTALVRVPRRFVSSLLDRICHPELACLRITGL